MLPWTRGGRAAPAAGLPAPSARRPVAGRQRHGAARRTWTAGSGPTWPGCAAPGTCSGSTCAPRCAGCCPGRRPPGSTSSRPERLEVAQRVAGPPRLQRRPAGARGAAAGGVRVAADPAHRRRTRAPVLLHLLLPGPAPGGGHRRPRVVLEHRLPAGARRAARALPQARVAGGPVDGRARARGAPRAVTAVPSAPNVAAAVRASVRGRPRSRRDQHGGRGAPHHLVAHRAQQHPAEATEPARAHHHSWGSGAATAPHAPARRPPA